MSMTHLIGILIGFHIAYMYFISVDSKEFL